MSSPPVINYPTPSIPSSAIRYEVGADCLVIYDTHPPVWRLVMAPVCVFTLGLMGGGLLAFTMEDGRLGLSLVAVVFLLMTVANAIVFLDDLRQWMRPGHIIVRDGTFSLEQMRFYGRVRRVCPIGGVRDVLVSKGSSSVHGMNDIVIRFHNARSVSMLTCQSVAEAQHLTGVI
ncbi:MAG: hypothetical protein ACREIT_02175, partial [Tepidisphaeraceae bacterium]